MRLLSGILIPIKRKKGLEKIPGALNIRYEILHDTKQNYSIFVYLSLINMKLSVFDKATGYHKQHVISFLYPLNIVRSIRKINLVYKKNTEYMMDYDLYGYFIKDGLTYRMLSFTHKIIQNKLEEIINTETQRF